jgi:hypothetical protein
MNPEWLTIKVAPGLPILAPWLHFHKHPSGKGAPGLPYFFVLLLYIYPYTFRENIIINRNNPGNYGAAPFDTGFAWLQVWGNYG